MTIEYTEFRHYPKPDFDTRTWHQQMHDFADQVDRDINGFESQVGIYVPVWAFGADYVVGQRAFDEEEQSVWQCLVPHTSSGATFGAYRTANPTHWVEISLEFIPRGAWAQSTAYDAMDHVWDTDEGVSAVCIDYHVSTASGTIRTDAAHWVFIVDLQAALTTTQRYQLILELQVFT